MTTCGFWPARDHLVAAVVDDEGHVHEKCLRASYTDEARWDLITFVEGHYGLDCDFVAVSRHTAYDPIAEIALSRGYRVWLVPDHLVDDLRIAAGILNNSASKLAVLLARLPLSQLLYRQIRPLRLQLPLFGGHRDDKKSQSF